MVVPGATIYTLMDFMKEPESVRAYLHNLEDPISVKFFESEFFSPNFDTTRQQILNRLWGVLRTRSIARMFGHRHNKLNLFEAMNRGSLILINTAKELLKQDGCEIFGRFFIALIAQATQERAAIPEKKRMDTLVYIDEAHDYFDQNIEMLLATARKYRVGLTLIHQFLGQFDRRLQKAVETNTAIKLVGGLSKDDARDLAGEMGCEPAFLRSMRKGAKTTEFACMVKDYTSSPVRITIPLDAMETQPKIDPVILEALKEANRRRYCANLKDRRPDGPDSPDNLPTNSELI
jgi:hypothetical protein